MYKVLITAQKNPEILRIIATEEPSDAKDKKIQKLIDENYTKYHEFYFQREHPQSIQNYELARKFLVDAQLFDDMMQARDQALASGLTEMKMGHINLLDKRYEITGSKEAPVAKKMFLPRNMIKYYKEAALAFNRENAPHLEDNFMKMETGYLMRLYVNMNRLLADPKSDEIFAGDNDAKAVIVAHMALIRNFLTCSRGVNFDIAITDPQFYESKMDLGEIAKHLEGFTIKDSPAYKEYEKKHFDREPAVYAMFKLAELYGYAGDAKEERLKEFLNADKASFHGIYWDGEYWTVRERGWEFDDEISPRLNKEAIDQIIKILDEQPDNIISHRHDAAVLADAYDYTSHVNRMSATLKKGYEAGMAKYKGAPREQVLEFTATG